MLIDIHCHILPGVDDGVPTVDESLALMRMEASGGTTAFVATSHVMEQRDIDSLPLRAELLAMLREKVKAEGIDVELYPGAEVYPFPAALKAVDAGLDLSLGGAGKYVLVDLPMTQFPNDLDSFLFELQSRGMTPILAHPERTAPVQHDPEMLRPLMERGVLLQVNAGSVLGQYGPGAVRSGHLILERRWAQFMASDSHRASQSPKLERGVIALAETLDEPYLRLLTTDSPQAAVQGAVLPPRPPEPERKKGRWDWLFRR